MIQAMFFVSRDEGMLGFTVQGHADAGDYGEDIVCSAVSALCQTAYLGIEEVAKATCDTHIAPSGEMTLLVYPENNPGWKDVQVLLKTLRLGLGSIAEGYPQNIQIMDLWR